LAIVIGDEDWRWRFPDRLADSDPKLSIIPTISNWQFQPQIGNPNRQSKSAIQIGNLNRQSQSAIANLNPKSAI
jgi:hypothetical protein